MVRELAIVRVSGTVGVPPGIVELDVPLALLLHEAGLWRILIVSREGCFRAFVRGSVKEVIWPLVAGELSTQHGCQVWIVVGAVVTPQSRSDSYNTST